ncbi:ATP-binding cassette domain-containing protein [Actinoplanes sp. NPDC051861]|uniref:ATP-binding cassette domain-containing protein n=1 Tax=Actinoplanes sp. NPDC051861 TaxID=3155170 RepID=UPI00343C2583
MLIAEGLRKRYGDVDALDDFELNVPAGEIHGLLGPNGAGKTTAVRAMATLVRVDAGRILINGFDVHREARSVRRQIGLVGQQAAVDEILSGRQNLVMFGRLYGLAKSAAATRAAELLETFELTEAADRTVSGYSGGMRRRLDIAAALILTPAVLFLDEPTTGLDPRARNEVWATVRQAAAGGTTVLLTTQYLDEADQLAAQISVMDHGRVIASGTPSELKRQIGRDRVTVTVDPASADALARRLPPVTRDGGTLTFEAGVSEVVRTLDDLEITADDLVLRRPTLDEVFLTLTAKETVR